MLRWFHIENLLRKMEIQKNAAIIGATQKLNFVEGAGIGLNVAIDSDRINIEIGLDGGSLSDGVAYVSKAGNDATGVVGDPLKPFLTIQAACDAAPTNGYVVVNPGTYNEAITLARRLNIFLNGANINGSISSNNVNGSVLMSNGSGTFKGLLSIEGVGAMRFYVNGLRTMESQTNDVLLAGANSQYYIRNVDEIILTGENGLNQTTSMRQLYMSGIGRITNTHPTGKLSKYGNIIYLNNVEVRTEYRILFGTYNMPTIHAKNSYFYSKDFCFDGGRLGKFENCTIQSENDYCLRVSGNPNQGGYGTFELTGCKLFSETASNILGSSSHANSKLVVINCIHNQTLFSGTSPTVLDLQNNIQTANLTPYRWTW